MAEDKEGPQPGPSYNHCEIRERALTVLAAQTATIYQMTELVSELNDQIKSKERRIQDLETEAAKNKHAIDKLVESNKLLEQKQNAEGPQKTL